MLTSAQQLGTGTSAQHKQHLCSINSQKKQKKKNQQQKGEGRIQNFPGTMENHTIYPFWGRGAWIYKLAVAEDNRNHVQFNSKIMYKLQY